MGILNKVDSFPRAKYKKLLQILPDYIPEYAILLNNILHEYNL
jgi:hypothetical protein